MARSGLRLVADIGGTNARFALMGAASAPRSDVMRYRVADHPSFTDAMQAFLSDHAGEDIAAAAICAAGPVASGRVKLTNAPWEIDAREVSDALGGAKVRLLNDLQAVAEALPWLGEAEAETLWSGKPSPERAPMIAINIGTGFGASVLVPAAGSWHSLAAEPGHMRFAPASDAERRMGAATYEDAISGPGLVRMRERLGGDIVPLFSGLLGRVSGDLVLATGTWGGVWFCGGVMDDWAQHIDSETFRDAFIDKGPMAERLACVPIRRITAPNPALIGLARLAMD